MPPLVPAVKDAIRNPFWFACVMLFLNAVSNSAVSGEPASVIKVVGSVQGIYQVS